MCSVSDVGTFYANLLLLVYRWTLPTSYSTFPGGAPDWRNFGKLSDEEAQKASGRAAESFEVERTIFL